MSQTASDPFTDCCKAFYKTWCWMCGCRPCTDASEKRIEELEAQVKKLGESIVELQEVVKTEREQRAN